MWYPLRREQRNGKDAQSDGEARSKRHSTLSNVARSSGKPDVLARKFLLSAIVLLVLVAIPAASVASVGATAAEASNTTNESGSAEIAVSPTSLGFGAVDVGDFERMVVEVSNEGDAPLRVDGADIAGGDDGDFQIDRGGKSASLDPGESYMIKVRFEPTTAGSLSSELQIESNDTDASPTTVALSGTGESETEESADDSEDSEDETEEESLSVDVDTSAPGNATVEIRHAEASDPVNVTFDDGVGYDGIYLDGLDLELDSDADEIDLDIRHRRTVSNETPALQIAAGADRYIEIEKAGIADEEIDAARFHFRMSEDRLGDDTPENVTLYRYSDGAWSELPTTFVEAQDGDYVFRATSPGFSAFAVGAQQAEFEVNGTDLTPATVTAGENATVDATIENTGEAAGTYTAGLTADNETVATRNVSLDAGESTNVTFEVAFDEAGEYDLAVNETAVGTLTVEAEPTPTETATPEPTATDTETPEPTTTETATSEPTETSAEPTATSAEPTETSNETTSQAPADTENEDSALPLHAISLVAVLLAVVAAATMYFRGEIKGRIGR